MPSDWVEAESHAPVSPGLQVPSYHLSVSPSPAFYSPPLSLCSLFCLWGIGLEAATPPPPSHSGPALSPLSLEVGEVPPPPPPPAPDWLAPAAKQLTSSKFTFLG